VPAKTDECNETLRIVSEKQRWTGFWNVVNQVTTRHWTQYQDKGDVSKW
jgi:hypothetical protein